MHQAKRKHQFYLWISLPFLLVAIAWLQEIIDQLLFAGNWNLPIGPGLPWWRLFTAPFSHSDFSHLIANTVVFLPLSWLVLSQGIRDYIAVLIYVVLMEIPLMLFWPIAIHGMSGFLYGLLGYLMLIGFIKRRLLTIMISIFCLFFYGGTLYSLIPGVSPAGVSWIGHISGFGGGALAAFSVYKEQ